MELLQLKYFKMVAECGRLNKAAEELFVSPPALSASISRLEKDLGIQLFDRGNNRIVLNERGKIFLNYVNRMFEELENAKLDMRHSLEERTASITVAVTNSNLWIKFFKSYSITRPEMTLSATTLSLTQVSEIDLLNRYVFLMADSSDLIPDGLDSELLFVDRPYVMLPKDHRLASSTELSLRELENERIVLPTADFSLNRRIRKMCANAQISLRHASEFPGATMQYMVEEGAGIAITTERSVRKNPNIVCLPLRDPIRWEQRLYWNRNRTLSWEEAEFKEYLVAFFQEGEKRGMFQYEYYLYSL